jgi:hypothetical protein
MRNMKATLIAIFLIVSLMGFAAASDGHKGLDTQPVGAFANKSLGNGTGQLLTGQYSSDATSAKYAQYFTLSQGKPGGQNKATNKHIEAPKKQATKATFPTTLYFGMSMQAVPYSQYKTYAPITGGNSLWIQGTTSWTQYAQVPQGSSLSLLATSSSGGSGYLYEIDPNGILSKNAFTFFAGTSQFPVYVDTVGEYILLFVINGQASNSVVIDVVPYTPIYLQPQMPLYNNPYPQGTILPPSAIPTVTMGDSAVTIASKGMRGYQVSVDGKYIGSEGTGKDPLDGTFSFKVVGNQNHEIRVYDGRFNYVKIMFFDRGGKKTIYVEPGMAA